MAAEFALVKVRWSQLDVLIKQGSSKASLIKHIIWNLDNYLSACQLGITIASLALWWVAEPLIASQFVLLNDHFHRWLDESSIHTIAIPVTFFLITTLHIVVGEQAPKSFAIRDPLSVAKYIASPLYRFYTILKPFIWFLNSLSLWFLSLFWLKGNHEEHSHSEEELRMIIAESEEDGQINAGEMELIHNVFDFDNREVSEIMTPSYKVFAIDKDDRSSIQLPQLIQEGYSRIPIYEWWMDNIIWRVLLKDIMSFALLWKDTKLDKLMRPIQFVPESMKVADCLRLLQSTHIHIAVVSSEHGTTLWLVTLEDIVEELVWDIHDESDEQTSIVTLQDDWSFLVDAWASIVDVNDTLPMPISESENYDTISGYINTLFGRIPSVNESIDTDHYMITILKTKKQRVESVKLETKAL